MRRGSFPQHASLALPRAVFFEPPLNEASTPPPTFTTERVEQVESVRRRQRPSDQPTGLPER